MILRGEELRKNALIEDYETGLSDEMTDREEWGKTTASTPNKSIQVQNKQLSCF
jgi:hypothetical protein